MTNGGWQLMNWTNNKASMNIASGATFDVWDGQDVIIDALTGSGTVDKLHPGNSPRLLTIGIANGSGTFSGTMKNTGGQLSFTKVGTGTQGSQRREHLQWRDGDQRRQFDPQRLRDIHQRSDHCQRGDPYD